MSGGLGHASLLRFCAEGQPMRHGGIIATLESHEAELRAPVRALSPFGSAARGYDRTDSDVDVAVALAQRPSRHTVLRAARSSNGTPPREH